MIALLILRAGRSAPDTSTAGPPLKNGVVMKILVVSGFLGAGKTTFITQMVKNFPNRRFAIYENEFAGQGIDTDRLKDDLEVSIYESLENCVCCTGKADFSASIITISCSVNPEFLIVEPTGLAKLGNVIQNIQQILYGDISLLEPVLILDAHAHKRNWALSPEIYEDQIRNSQTVFLSKTSLLISEEIEAVKRDVLALNPDAEIIEADFRTFGANVFWQILNCPFDFISTGVRDKLQIAATFRNGDGDKFCSDDAFRNGDGDKYKTGDFFTGVRDNREDGVSFNGDGDKFSWREHLSLTPLQKGTGTGVSPRPAFISDTNANHHDSHKHHHHHGEECDCDECKVAQGNEEHYSHDHHEEHETSGFEQVTFDYLSFPSPVHLISFLNGLVWGRYGDIARAKGFVPCGKEWLQFDLVDTIWEIIDSNPRDHSACIVIGKKLDRSGLKAQFN